MELKNNPIFGNKQARHFYYYLKGKCKKHGIKLILRNVKYLKLDGNVKCSGYFDDAGKRLVVATRSPLALEILVHEYGHLTQYIDNCAPWKNLGNSLDKLMNWLDGKNVRNIDKHIAASREMELDNEKRSVEIIKQFNLDINIDQYIAKANCYIYFYNWLKYSRKWSTPANSPYKNKRLIDAMPTKFQRSYNIIPKRVEKIFKQENI